MKFALRRKRAAFGGAPTAETGRKPGGMVATEGLGLANCQAIVSPKSGGAHAARVPRSISSTILFLLLGGGGAAGLVKLAGDRGGLQPGEMAQGYPDINGEGVSPAAQMAASDEDASSINDAGPNKPAPPTIYAPVLVPQPLLQAPCGANCASSDINDKDQDIINDVHARADTLISIGSGSNGRSQPVSSGLRASSSSTRGCWVAALLANPLAMRVRRLGPGGCFPSPHQAARTRRARRASPASLSAGTPSSHMACVRTLSRAHAVAAAGSLSHVVPPKGGLTSVTLAPV